MVRSIVAGLGPSTEPDGTGATKTGCPPDVLPCEEVRSRRRDLQLASDRLAAFVTQLEMAQAVSHVGSWRLDVESGQVEWSSELRRIFGFSPSDRVPTFDEHEALVAPESWRPLRAVIGAAIERGEPYEFEFDIVRPSGEWRRVIGRGRPMYEGKPCSSLVGTIQDIEDLTQARRARDEAADRAEIAVRAAGMGVWGWAAHEGLTVDERARDLLGEPPKARSEHVAEAFRATFADADPKIFEAFVDDLRRRGAFSVRLRLSPPAQKPRYVALEGRQLGERVVGVVWDITASEQARLALERNERFLTEFVEHAPAAIAMLDGDLRYIRASRRWIQDYRLSSEGYLGMAHEQALKEYPVHWQTQLRSALRGHVELASDTQVRRLDGSSAWIQWEARPWMDIDGSIGGILVFSMDTTDRKLLQDDLAKRTAELEASNQDLQQLAYAASHDLKTPLRAMATCAGLLERSNGPRLDEKGAELLHAVVAGAARMRALVDGLLEYARVEARGEALRPVAARACLDRALSALKSELVGAQTTVRIDALPNVYADPRQLERVFQNLIENAIKYKSPDRALQVRVHGAPKSDGWELAVADNGMGIEERFFHRIFELYQRLHERSKIPGSGMGLSLCRRILERHGGRIWVESEIGQGSSFHLFLPFPPSSAGDRKAPWS